MDKKTEMDYRVIGRRVRDRRSELGMTQSELAARIKVSASFVGHIERGEKIASLDTMMRLSKALEVSMDWLVWGGQRRCEGEECPLFRELSTLLSAYGLDRRT